VRTCPLWLLATLVGSGCSEWPRSTHLDGTELSLPADEDARGAVNTPQWLDVQEIEPNDQPTQVRVYVDVLLGQGFQLTGALDGSGWFENGVPEPLVSEACGSSGDRGPLASGDYLADVDFFAFIPAEDAVLCASGEVGTDAYGWDMLLFEIDVCGIPVALRQDPTWPDGLLGFGRGGALQEWGTPVYAGVHYALMIAAYHPNAVDETVPYAAQISLQPKGPNGTTALCPLLTFEVQP